MVIASHILLFSGLSVAFWQDLKFRAIHWMVFAWVFILAMVLTYQGTTFSWQTVLMNLVFSTAVVGGLFVYLSLKNRRWTNIFRAHFGLGDYLFFLAVAPLFEQQNFILFFVSGMVFAAFTQQIPSFFIEHYQKKSIPLAGLLSLYILLLEGITYCTTWNPFHDSILQ